VPGRRPGLGPPSPRLFVTSGLSTGPPGSLGGGTHTVLGSVFSLMVEVTVMKRRPVPVVFSLVVVWEALGSMVAVKVPSLSEGNWVTVLTFVTVSVEANPFAWVLNLVTVIVLRGGQDACGGTPPVPV